MRVKRVKSLIDRTEGEWALHGKSRLSSRVEGEPSVEIETSASRDANYSVRFEKIRKEGETERTVSGRSEGAGRNGY